MKASTLFLSCVFVLTSCATFSLRLSEEELASFTPEQKAAIKPAESSLDAARAARGDRVKDHKATLRQVEIAEELIGRAEADLRVAQLEFDGAQETGDADAMVPAKTKRAKAAKSLAHAKAQLTAREAEEDVAQARIDEAQAEVAKAEAGLELARLNALLDGKETPTPEDEERRAEFKAQVAASEVDLAQSKSATAAAENALKSALDALAVFSPPSSAKDPAPSPEKDSKEAKGEGKEQKKAKPSEAPKAGAN